MKLPTISTPLMLGAGALIVAAVYVKTKGAANVGQSLGAGAVDMANGVISGGVIAIGDAVGVPATSKTECQKAMDEGRTWDASFACPAADFVSWVAAGRPTIDASKIGGATGSW